ncbi:hypothetical protein TNCV_1007021 [Trichonephila clavipes]|nr:hypothetical protein TNCV_1007021 [Trichonephila clavipes]
MIHGTDSNQDDIMDSNIKLTWGDSMEDNSQPRQFMQQNRHKFRPSRNNENVQRQGGQLIIDSTTCFKHLLNPVDTGSNMCH